MGRRAAGRPRVPERRVMPPLLRAAGRRLRHYVLPLVGFWDLLVRLDELRARMGALEAAANAPRELPETLARLDELRARMGALEAAANALRELRKRSPASTSCAPAWVRWKRPRTPCASCRTCSPASQRGTDRWSGS